MNEACAAGTGSFLEEQAEKLGIDINGEFARMALSSPAPIRLGERCTVFMERDVMTYQQRGARREDLVAGLAFSIAYNYLNRLVARAHHRRLHLLPGRDGLQRLRRRGLRQILDKEIIVPPHNGVIGALGMALLARERIGAHRRRDDVPRLGPRAGRLHRRRLRLQGLLQRVRRAPVHDRGREDLLGRQVLRPVPQAGQGRQAAGHRRPHPLREELLLAPYLDGRRSARRRRRADRRHPAQHVHVRPAAVLGDVLRRARRAPGPLARERQERCARPASS